MKPRIAIAMAALCATAAWTAPAAAQQPTARVNGAITLPPDAKALQDIKVAPARLKMIAGLVSATAVVEPNINNVVHVTPRIEARVAKLLVDLGKEVKPGDRIAILSSIELGQAKNEFFKARSLEQITARNLAREERLFRDKIAAEKDMLDARARHDEALAEYRSAREKLRLLLPGIDVDRLSASGDGQPLSDFSLTAPIAGTLVKRDLTVGSMVAPDAPVITIMNLDRIWVIANIYEHDLAQLKLGEASTVTVPAYPGERFSGTISYIGDIVDQKTRTVQARIDVANPEHRLKPGMFASADIESVANQREVLAAPASAVYEVNGQKVVFVQTGPNAFAARPVKLGEMGHEDVEIVSGLAAGDRIVVKGGLVLKALMVNTGS